MTVYLAPEITDRVAAGQIIELRNVAEKVPQRFLVVSIDRNKMYVRPMFYLAS